MRIFRTVCLALAAFSLLLQNAVFAWADTAGYPGGYYYLYEPTSYEPPDEIPGLPPAPVPEEYDPPDLPPSPAWYDDESYIPPSPAPPLEEEPEIYYVPLPEYEYGCGYAVCYADPAGWTMSCYSGC